MPREEVGVVAAERMVGRGQGLCHDEPPAAVSGWKLASAAAEGVLALPVPQPP